MKHQMLCRRPPTVVPKQQNTKHDNLDNSDKSGRNIKSTTSKRISSLVCLINQMEKVIEALLTL